MIDIEKYIIRKGDQMAGVMWEDIREYILTPDQFKKFEKWMACQTCGCLDDKCLITLVYVGDLKRFMNNQPIID